MFAMPLICISVSINTTTYYTFSVMFPLFSLPLAKLVIYIPISVPSYLCPISCLLTLQPIRKEETDD